MQKTEDKQNYNGLRVAIIGFGMEGKDACNFFLKNRSKVSIFDVKEKKDLDLSGMVTGEISFYCGQNYDLRKLIDFDLVVRSPGVYRYLPELIACDKEGIEVTSVVRLFLKLYPGKVIGVTGTKGKGTTSTLIYEILKRSGFRVYLVGNIGTPCLNLLRKLKEGDWVVMEMSSFQLIDLNKSPDIGVVLNITVDHLDWHKNENEYVNAKKNILVHQKSGNTAVINNDYPKVKKFAKLGSGKKYFFSSLRKVNGSYVVNRNIFVGNSIVGEVKDLLLRGKHNWENITAAICASRLAGATLYSIKKTVFSFKGLEHRLELVRTFNGVTFYNDSFSTNPQTTIAAINSFNEPITIILGGFEKNLDYIGMARAIKRANVNTCVLIGDIARKIEKALNVCGYLGGIIKTGHASMKTIVHEALTHTPSGGVVLLSPATSSFDMFENYKIRGLEFKKEVRGLGK